jgi:hypothetical protein
MEKTIYRIAQGDWVLDVNGKVLGEFKSKEMAQAVYSIVEVNGDN